MNPATCLRVVAPDESSRRKRTKPAKDYRAVLKARGTKMVRIERTEKRKGDLELIGTGEMVVVR